MPEKVIAIVVAVGLVLYFVAHRLKNKFTNQNHESEIRRYFFKIFPWFFIFFVLDWTVSSASAYYFQKPLFSLISLLTPTRVVAHFVNPFSWDFFLGDVFRSLIDVPFAYFRNSPAFLNASNQSLSTPFVFLMIVFQLVVIVLIKGLSLSWLTHVLHDKSFTFSDLLHQSQRAFGWLLGLEIVSNVFASLVSMVYYFLIYNILHWPAFRGYEYEKLAASFIWSLLLVPIALSLLVLSYTIVDHQGSLKKAWAVTREFLKTRFWLLWLFGAVWLTVIFGLVQAALFLQWTIVVVPINPLALTIFCVIHTYFMIELFLWLSRGIKPLAVSILKPHRKD